MVTGCVHIIGHVHLTWATQITYISNSVTLICSNTYIPEPTQELQKWEGLLNWCVGLLQSCELLPDLTFYSDWCIYFCPFLRLSVKLQMQVRNHNIMAMCKCFEESYNTSMDPLLHSILWISIFIEGVLFCITTEMKSNFHSPELSEFYVGIPFSFGMTIWKKSLSFQSELLLN